MTDFQRGLKPLKRQENGNEREKIERETSFSSKEKQLELSFPICTRKKELPVPAHHLSLYRGLLRIKVL